MAQYLREKTQLKHKAGCRRNCTDQAFLAALDLDFRLRVRAREELKRQ